ncbi:hypothetical protein B0F90DRAFT_1751469 [Multifurca ochricompacta]|uniref:Uncharacterized protein n=1 Tax=Multifurca ochricompacta TaxID=376703 RepID=A0AAD4QL01_9AGAM|nr:hypothetical protein B0F90DRAFT_1751469 [Multifurca ochricompacta]
MIRQIAREEGIRGFYKGLSASYLGVTEGTIQWVLYERLKRLAASTNGQGGGLQEWAGMLGSAGTAKCVASLITYPHEVLWTRLRQPLVNGQKIKGVSQQLDFVALAFIVHRTGLMGTSKKILPNIEMADSQTYSYQLALACASQFV